MNPEGRKPRPEADRFWEKVDRASGDCWLWTGAVVGDGYGLFRVGSMRDGSSRMIRSHRWSYETLVGPIPEGLQLDHLCRVRACVNPGHLEPVTLVENVRRGLVGKINNDQSRKTHCPQGHPYDDENTYFVKSTGYRRCRTCNRERQGRAA